MKPAACQCTEYQLEKLFLDRMIKYALDNCPPNLKWIIGDQIGFNPQSARAAH